MHQIRQDPFQLPPGARLDPSGPALKASDLMQQVIPGLRITNHARSKALYVDKLGFCYMGVRDMTLGGFRWQSTSHLHAVEGIRGVPRLAPLDRSADAEALPAQARGSLVHSDQPALWVSVTQYGSVALVLLEIPALGKEGISVS